MKALPDKHMLHKYILWTCCGKLVWI